ncbi:MAG: hypothetical protein Q9163_005727 [Psora crenata]
MAIPTIPAAGGDIWAGGTVGMSGQEAAMVRAMQAGMESCPVKSVISGGIGFALGGMFGLFMSSVCFPSKTDNVPDNK